MTAPDRDMSVYEQRGFELQDFDVRLFPPPLYNLGGKSVLKSFVNASGLTGYVSRVHDMDGQKVREVALDLGP